MTTPSPFVAGRPLQFAWDNTSISAFKQCPRKYYLSIIEGWVPKRMAPPLAFGIRLHQGLELFDKFTAAGMDREEALVQALLQTCRASAVHDESGKFKGYDLGDDPARSVWTLMRSIVWYVDYYHPDPLQTYVMGDTPAIELSFKVELPRLAPDGQSYLYCGHIDKVAHFGEQLVVVDRKHTLGQLDGNYFGRFTPQSQFTGYLFGGRALLQQPLHGVLVDAVQVGVGFTRFGRGFAPRSEGSISDWFNGLLHFIKQVEFCAETNVWPMNEESCYARGQCQFVGVCGKDPSVRARWLEADFMQRVWNPLEVRDK